MDRQQAGGDAAGEATIDDGVDGAMVGLVIEAHALVALARVEPAVARNDGAIREAHDKRGIVGATVRVDQQPRVACHHRRGTQRRGERPRHLRRADVVGDMAPELLRRQAQRAVARWQSIAGMVAQQNQAGVGAAWQDAIAVVVLGADAVARPQRVMSHVPTIVGIAKVAKRQRHDTTVIPEYPGQLDARAIGPANAPSGQRFASRERAQQRGWPMSYVYLAIAIIAEVIGTSALKASEEFTRLVPSLIVVAGYVVAFFFLSLTLRTIPVGIAYAIWAGAGIALIVAVGAILFQQVPDLPAIVGLTLIVAGVVIVNTMSHTTVH